MKMTSFCFLATLIAGAMAAAAGPQTVNFNQGWRFFLGEAPGWTCSTPSSASVFPIDLTDTLVAGLVPVADGASSPAACAAQCGCRCQAWQFCWAGDNTSLACVSSSPVPPGPPPSACGQGSFPADLDNRQCLGLSQAPAASADECASVCCGRSDCSVYQWCSNSSCSPMHSCWIGSLAGGCVPVAGWVSGARNITPAHPQPLCLVGLLADYGPGNWITAQPGRGTNWLGRGRLQPPQPLQSQATGPAAVQFDDSGWELIDLPHDYLARGTPTNVNQAPHQQEHGAIPFSNGFYRKHFSVPPGAVMARLYFDGVYRSASIFLNGVLAAQHEEGYTGFSVWLHNVSGTELGADNVIAIHVDATTYPFELWSYEGAGITRDVSLIWYPAPVAIVPFGVFVPTRLAGPVVAPDGPAGDMWADALALPVADVANGDQTAAANVTVRFTILAPNGTTAAGPVAVSAILAPGGWARLQPPDAALRLPEARLWMPVTSAAQPPRPLYTLWVNVSTAEGTVAADAVAVPFGVRQFTFEPAGGFFVNGFYVKIRGFSVHQDVVGSGAFAPPNVVRYRMQRLLELGGNAYRTAHNPVSSHVLDEADRRGILVWSENRFLRNFSNYVSDAGDMVARDRNHPSIFTWSLCNENACGEAGGWEGSTDPSILPGAAMGQVFMAHIKTLDDTRPVTANNHNTIASNGSLLRVLDLMGLTYDYGSLDVIHAARPDAPLMNGESASCQSSRGDWGSGQGALACTAASWTPAAERSWVAGQFVWSLFDYGGESAWPAVYSYYGVMDICGFPKPVASWYYTWWAAANRPGGNASVLAFPDWSFPASEIGNRVTITALSPAVGGSLVLTVNGKPVGQPQPIQQFGFAVWTDVPYQPGSYTVQAVAANGTVLGEHTSASCGAASALRALLEWPGSGPDGALLADGVDAALVRVAVVDATGCTVPYAANNLSFAVSANGQLLGLGNGDSTDHQPRSGATTRPAYAGLAMAVLRAVPDTVQPIVLTIAAVDGSLAPAVISVPTSPVLAAAL